MSGYDVYIEGVPSDEVRNVQFITFGEKSIAVKGVYKLLSRVMKCFMTPKGTDLSDVDYGTDIIAHVGGNVDPKTLRILAGRAITDVESKIREYDAEYILDDDERLGSLELLDIVVEPDSVKFSVAVTSAQGNKAYSNIWVYFEE